MSKSIEECLAMALTLLVHKNVITLDEIVSLPSSNEGKTELYNLLVERSQDK